METSAKGAAAGATLELATTTMTARGYMPTLSRCSNRAMGTQQQSVLTNNATAQVILRSDRHMGVCNKCLGPKCLQPDFSKCRGKRAAQSLRQSAATVKHDVWPLKTTTLDGTTRTS